MFELQHFTRFYSFKGDLSKNHFNYYLLLVLAVWH